MCEIELFHGKHHFGNTRGDFSRQRKNEKHTTTQTGDAAQEKVFPFTWSQPEASPGTRAPAWLPLSGSRSVRRLFSDRSSCNGRSLVRVVLVTVRGVLATTVEARTFLSASRGSFEVVVFSFSPLFTFSRSRSFSLLFSEALISARSRVSFTSLTSCVATGSLQPPSQQVPHVCKPVCPRPRVLSV